MIRHVRGPKGPVVPLTDVADEVNRDPATLRKLAKKLKFPLVEVRVRSRRGNRRRMRTICIEPRNLSTLMKESSALRRYQPGVRHSGGVIGVHTNGSHAPTEVEVPVTARAAPRATAPLREGQVEIVAVTREAIAAALKPFVQKGLAKLSFDAATGSVSYAVQQAESFKI